MRHCVSTIYSKRRVFRPRDAYTKIHRLQSIVAIGHSLSVCVVPYNTVHLHTPVSMAVDVRHNNRAPPLRSTGQYDSSVGNILRRDTASRRHGVTVHVWRIGTYRYERKPRAHTHAHTHARIGYERKPRTRT